MFIDRWRHPAALLSVLATVQLAGLALFCKGFFPYKVYLPGFADADSLPPWPDGSFASPFTEPAFDRLAVVVVDALRNDFVLGIDSGFDFVKSLIERGEALPYTARATAPTVTMPRIKALTTGTIPSFLDAILNIAESDTSSSLLHHDNWVHQFRQSGNRTIYFYGDDTWIRLFPDAFAKMDGTTSFYVSDTVQVDLNVTRHIRSAFAEQDWDAIILHYLGLDHVGHLGGPYSPLMKPKQKEMDQVIETIYEIVAQEDAKRIVHDPDAKGTLIVLCGDHGMNEMGNHGGSSVGETSAALVFLSPRFASRPTPSRPSTAHLRDSVPTVLGYPVVDQVDLVPTLASLFGFPIPKNSLGKIIPAIFQKLSQDPNKLLRTLQANAYQLGLLLAEIDPAIAVYLSDPFSFDITQYTDNPGRWYAQAVHLHRDVLSGDSHVLQEAFEHYTKFIDLAQSRLANTASNYDLRLMATGTSLIIGCTVFLIAWSKKATEGVRSSNGNVWNFSKLFSIVGISAYCISMFASSFVEEEHSLWYYYVQTLCLLSAVQSMRLGDIRIRDRYWLLSMQIIQMILFRVSTVIHCYSAMWEDSIWHLLALALVTPALLVTARLVLGTGVVGTNSNEVTSSANYIRLLCKGALIMLICLTSCLVMVYKIRDATTAAPSTYTDALASLIEFASQLDQVQLGRLIYNYGGSCVFIACGLAYVDRRATDLQLRDYASRTGKYLDLMLYVCTPILVLLTRSHNAVLFVIYCIQFELMRAWNRALRAQGKDQPPWLVATQTLCIIQAAFFATGHSNSISAVDLSNAYIGVDGYDPVTIGLLTFLSNWSTALWWGTAGWILVTDMADASSAWWNYLVALSAVFGCVLSVLSVSVTVLREHLFIWTVFSPKYLYQMAWTVLFHWCAQALLGTIFVKTLAA